MTETYDATTAECLVFSFKAGLASALAHDLKLRVESFRIEIDTTSGDVVARFDAGSLRCVCAVKNGRDDAEALSRGDRRKVDKAIVADVLGAGRYPEISFVARAVRAEAERFAVNGELTLCGRIEALRVDVETHADFWSAHAVVHQPVWGIEPFKAMFGTLRIQPDVEIHLTLRR